MHGVNAEHRADYAESNEQMNQSVEQHRADAPSQLGCAVVTVSDTRTLETDTGGAALCDGLAAVGHRIVERTIIPDDPAPMRPLVIALANRDDVDAILLTGGTGMSRRDQTYETIAGVLTKHLPGYGELFRWLSYQEIGTATILSRAIGGLLGTTVVLTMPGSPKAVKLAVEKIIAPELPHLVREARR